MNDSVVKHMFLQDFTPMYFLIIVTSRKLYSDTCITNAKTIEIACDTKKNSLQLGFFFLNSCFWLRSIHETEYVYFFFLKKKSESLTNIFFLGDGY